MTLQILVFLLLATTPTGTDDYCGNFPEPGFDDPAMSRFVRWYSNPTYHFSVRVPKGLVGHSSPPPLPQHGFGIVLSWTPRAYIYFDGSYNAADEGNTTEIASTRLRWLRDSSLKILSTQRQHTHLGPLSARRFVARHTCPKVRGVFVEDTTIALSRGIIYTVSLLTTDERYQRDRRIMNEMLKTWRLSNR